MMVTDLLLVLLISQICKKYLKDILILKCPISVEDKTCHVLLVPLCLLLDPLSCNYC